MKLTTIRLKHLAIVATMVVSAFASSTLLADTKHLSKKTFKQLVGKNGEISLPTNYRATWSHMGSWVIEDENSPGYGFHDVYTQPDAVAHYNKTGEFPDGAVLVKEVRAVESGAKTTGVAEWAGDINIWFVMIKDTQGRFGDNPHWKEGWGWALFEAKDPAKNVSKSFEETCKGCHIPAQQSDWVFIEGYPTLEFPGQ